MQRKIDDSKIWKEYTRILKKDPWVGFKIGKLPNQGTKERGDR